MGTVIGFLCLFKTFGVIGWVNFAIGLPRAEDEEMMGAGNNEEGMLGVGVGKEGVMVVIDVGGTIKDSPLSVGSFSSTIFVVAIAVFVLFVNFVVGLTGMDLFVVVVVVVGLIFGFVVGFVLSEILLILEGLILFCWLCFFFGETFTLVAEV